MLLAAASPDSDSFLAKLGHWCAMAGNAFNNFFSNNPSMLLLLGLVLLGMFFWYFATEFERRARNIGTVLAIAICAFCVLAATPPDRRLKGGIDIVGGLSFSLHIDPIVGSDGEPMPITKNQVEEAIKIIRSRLDNMGTSEAMIASQGRDGILVQMPGVAPEDAERVRTILQKVAKLEFRQVNPRSFEAGPDGKTLAQRVLDGSEIVPNSQAFLYTPANNDESGKPPHPEALLLYRNAALTGKDISSASPANQPGTVEINLSSVGGDKMVSLTSPMRPGVDRIAVVLDGVVKSAPVVKSVPLGRHFVIEGLNAPGEVQNLINTLKNPLENPLRVGEKRDVSPTLGAAVVKQGLLSGVVALLLTFLMVLAYYRMSGFIAIIGLIMNTIILFGVMAMIHATFTLPGIAGMILTVGMAVDANVLIYERLREELKAGKSLKNAIESSYDRAFSAIFDSHVTSLITAVILFMLGSGTVKGFAVTLTIGVTASLFSAILVTRVIFRWGLDLNWFKKLSFLNLIKAKNYDFLGKRKIAITLAIITFIASLVAFGVKGQRALGIDFLGGTTLTYQLGHDTKVTVSEVNTLLSKVHLDKEPYPQEEKNPTTGELLTIRCATQDAKRIDEALRSSTPALSKKHLTGDTTLTIEAGRIELKLDEVNKVLDSIKDKLTKPATAEIEGNAASGVTLRVICATGNEKGGDASIVLNKLRESIPLLIGKPETIAPATLWDIPCSTEEVSALVGTGFLWQSLLAIALGFVGIIVYMTARFEFSFALGGFIAIFHDVIICLGIVVMFGGQLSLIHVGAVLTIAGYSISDTIVVFDRVREMLMTHTDSTEKIMNDAVNATLSRTLLTSGATLVSVAVLTFLGGTSLRDFGFIIFIGIIIGTFSSIFIASPVVLWWSKRKGRDVREDVLASAAREAALKEAP